MNILIFTIYFHKHIVKKNNYPSEKWNSIINKTPLFGATNRSIGGHAPSKYLKNIKEKYNVDDNLLSTHINSHCIDIIYLEKDDFDGFMRDRADKLLDLIELAMGKKIKERQTLYDLI